MICSPSGSVCLHAKAPTHTLHTRACSLSCVLCHPWLWEALARVEEDGALLNPLRPHVQDCMTRPSVAPVRARQRCVYIPGGLERERRGEWWGRTASEGKMALALETRQFVFCILTDSDYLPRKKWNRIRLDISTNTRCCSFFKRVQKIVVRHLCGQNKRGD